MNDQEQIRLLLEGVDAWNEFRKREKNWLPNLRILGNPTLMAITTRINYRSSDHDLSGINFRGADLTGSDLSHSNLSDSNLRAAKLCGTDLKGTDLFRADISYSQIWKAKLFLDGDKVQYSRIKNLEPKNIENIKDLLNLQRELDDYYSYWTGDNAPTLYFRGESSDAWELVPSVFRTSNLMKWEREMLNELITAQPKQFSSTASSFDQLVLARHHGLPTRLLDVTKSPLVGLINACEERYGAHGRLHIFVVPRKLIRPFDSDAVSIVANFAKLTRYEQSKLLSKDSETVFADLQNDAPMPANRYDYLGILKRLCHFVAQEKSYFENRIDYRDFFRVFVVEPQQSFDRLRAQSGAFLISAFHERFEQEEILKWNNGIPVYDHYTVKVPSYRKRHILEESRRLNITRETLIPGLDSSAQAIKERYMQG